MASYEERLNHLGAIPVCAVSGDDKYAAYSSPGVNLWICAPSAKASLEYHVKPIAASRYVLSVRPDWMATTDLTGSAGNNQGVPAPTVGQYINNDITALLHEHLQFGSGGFWIGIAEDRFPVVASGTSPNPSTDPTTCYNLKAVGCHIEIYKQPGDSSYNRFFSGTSAAAPVVSGVIALLRAQYPQLSWRDIKLILAESAEQVDPAASTWQNGAPAYDNDSNNYTHSLDYGFGLINASAAMDLAKEWTALPPQQEYETSDQSGTISVGKTILTVDVVDNSVDFIEYVQLDIMSSYGDFGDLNITLRSPQSVLSPFARSHECAVEAGKQCDDLINGFTFGSAAHLGEDSSGKWTLEIDATETAPIEWRLRFYGHSRQ